MNNHGAGLGLTVCKGLVEQLGGKIKLISKFNFGTKVSFSIKNHFIDNLDESISAVESSHLFCTTQISN